MIKRVIERGIAVVVVDTAAEKGSSSCSVSYIQCR